MLEQIKTKLLCTNQCLSISSPNNFGISTLLRELSHLSDTPELLMVYFDFNLRADDSTQAFYELVQRQLLHSFKAKELPCEKLEALYRLYSSPAAMVNSFNLAHSFLGAIDEALQILSATDRFKKLVLLLDEFDQPMRYLPGLVLLQLRALKDRYPDQLSYVTATLLPLLACGREEEEEGVAEFYELFSAAELIRLGGLSLQEASTFAIQVNPALTAPQQEQIYTLAGGHPSLTHLIAGKVERFPQLVPVSETSYSLAETLTAPDTGKEEVEQSLKLDQEIRLECARLWRSLPESEQQALLHYLEGIETISLDTPLGSLSERGLVIRDPASGTSRLFSKVFEWFVQEKFRSVVSVVAPTPALAEPIVGAMAESNQIAYDPRRELVIFVQDKIRPPLSLSGNAARLFNYLYMRQSEPYCTKDELITAIWGYSGYGTENLDKLVSDLRQEIGDYSKQLIRTIPRRGLQMVGVREWQNG